MIKELIKLANHLDSRGFAKEADYLDGIIRIAKNNEIAYEMKVESFSITDNYYSLLSSSIPGEPVKDDGEKNSIVVQFIQERGLPSPQEGLKAAERRINQKSDSKIYNSSDGKSILYELVHHTTPNHNILKNTPYEMELMVKRVKNGQEVGKEVYRHTGLDMSSQIKEKYDEARKGLITLDQKEQKLDSLLS